MPGEGLDREVHVLLDLSGMLERVRPAHPHSFIEGDADRVNELLKGHGSVKVIVILGELRHKRAREQNRIADLLITNQTGLSAVLTPTSPETAGTQRALCSKLLAVIPSWHSSSACELPYQFSRRDFDADSIWKTESVPPTSPRETLRAVWTPGWYNLDQSITVGQVQYFYVYKEIPDLSEMKWPPQSDPDPLWPSGSTDLVFYNTLLKPDAYTKRRLRIDSIEHPELGTLESIATQRFGVYEFRTTTQSLEVEAEERPGRCYDNAVTVEDWSVRVEVTEESGRCVTPA